MDKTKKQKKPTQTQILRAILAKGEWVDSLALVEAGVGFRYASAVYDVRNGLDGGPPLDIEAQSVGKGQKWAYRLRPKPQPREQSAANDTDTSQLHLAGV